MAEKKEFSVWAPAIAVPFIKSNEGCRLTSYRDPAGVWTVGYGSTRLASGNPVIRNIKITQDLCLHDTDLHLNSHHRR